LKKTQGIGINAIATNPSNDTAQENPRLFTICAVKRGNDDDIVNRMKVVAARTEAP
jgi:hypothetical protein